MSDKHEAYNMAAKAAQIDFSSALAGLMAGHSMAIVRLEAEVARKDAALLASLALSGKGVRIGAGSGLAATVVAGINTGSHNSITEADFAKKYSDV